MTFRELLLDAVEMMRRNNFPAPYVVNGFAITDTQGKLLPHFHPEFRSPMLEICWTPHPRENN